MGERLLCKQEVIGSIPFTSTLLRADALRSAGPARREAECPTKRAARSRAESKRENVACSVPAFGFQAKGCLFFNNSEEAKRINSANVSARGWCRVVIAFIRALSILRTANAVA